ncbi:MAG: chitobiase/beta-hexosaminidase C-terminal domain-containing protein, partial [Muribaculaceae bacterium]|nr:chitobiase/beta-hexosaminidase C-terminal domain-containing protein [Muribaculaceae bacterium]
FIKDKGAIVNGTIEFVEPSEKDGRTLASEITFRPERAFTGRSIDIEIGKDVKAYSGISLGEDYHGTAQVLSEVSTISIVGDPVFTVGESTEINLAVVLAAKTEGVKVRAEIATPSVLSLNESSATVDADGLAHFTGYGIMAGKAIVKFSVENTDTEYTMTAAVSHKAKSKVERPVASLPENTPVAQGTPLYLSTPTAGAYILYTVDGSDPSLVSESVLHYDGSPIIINDDITVRAIAVAPDMEDSDEASFRYVVNKISGADRPDAGRLSVSVSPNPVDDIMTIRSGSAIRKVSVYGTTGVKVAEHTCDRACSEVEINIKNIAGGIYIVMTETSDGVSEHRIIKR